MQAWLSLPLGEIALGRELRQESNHGALSPAIVAARKKCRRDQAAEDSTALGGCGEGGVEVRGMENLFMRNLFL
jgi:hypothetical protein